MNFDMKNMELIANILIFIIGNSKHFEKTSQKRSIQLEIRKQIDQEEE